MAFVEPIRRASVEVWLAPSRSGRERVEAFDFQVASYVSVWCVVYVFIIDAKVPRWLTTTRNYYRSYKRKVEIMFVLIVEPRVREYKFLSSDNVLLVKRGISMGWIGGGRKCVHALEFSDLNVKCIHWKHIVDVEHHNTNGVMNWWLKCATS